MSFTDWLGSMTQGGAPPNVTTTGTSTQSLPDWYLSYLTPTIQAAQQVAALPYPDYGATGMPRIAGFTAPQLQAQNMVQQNVGNYQPYMGAAAATAADAASPFDPNQLNQYLSPYLSGVNGAINQQASQLWNETIAPTIQDTFTMNGQTSSTREGDVMAHAARDLGSGVAQQTALADQNAYNAANQNYLSWNTQQQNASKNLGALGQLQQGLDTQAAASLDTVGQQQQQLGQQNLNMAYQDFMNQAGWPQQQTQYMMNTLNGVNPGGTSTNIGVAPMTTAQSGAGSASPLGTLAMLGIAGGALFGKNGLFG